ncbi:class I SAM-dependent methyltransferase [Paracidovorax avenae]
MHRPGPPPHAALHGHDVPSEWITRWAHLVPPRGHVLDVACGSGRHLRWFHARGHAVSGVDRSAEAIDPLTPLGELIHADIEQGPWPFAGRRFDAVVVTHYLWRPLLPALAASVAPGGVLLYETFARGNGTVGRPSRPEFLLEPGELLAAFPGLRVVAYEDGFLPSPERFVQRLAAVREAPGDGPPRHLLVPPASG